MRRRGEDVQGIKSCGEWGGGEGGNKFKVAERERERERERGSRGRGQAVESTRRIPATWV